VKLIRERGVTVAQASRDLSVHGMVLRNWMKAFADDPQHAFPGHGQLKPEQAEIARMKREVTKLKAERDIIKKPRPTSQRNQREVRFHREAPGDLAAGWLCGALRVSRGGFYAWLIRPCSRRARSDEDLAAKVQASFRASDRT